MAKLLSLYFLSIFFSFVWACCLIFAPSHFIESYAKNSGADYRTIFWLIILGVSPLIKLTSIYLTQRFSEDYFLSKRLEFLSNYESNSNQYSILFSQSAFLIKEGYKSLYVDLPVIIGLVILIFIYSIDQKEHYFYIVLFSFLWGLGSIVFTLYVVKNTKLNIGNVDNKIMVLHNEFVSSPITYKVGKISEEFKEIFAFEGANSAKSFVKYAILTILPGVVSEIGLVIALVLMSLFFVQNDMNFNQIFSIFFQVTLILSILMSFSHQIPSIKTLLTFLDSNKKNLPKKNLIEFNLSNTKEKLTLKTKSEKIEFQKKNIYQLYGKNGSGKTTFLVQLAKKMGEKNINVAYLFNKSNLSVMTLKDEGSQLSDGERQIENLLKVIEKKPNVLILDEAINSLDKDRLKLAQKIIQLNSHNMITFIVDHQYEFPNALKYQIEKNGNLPYLKDTNRNI